MLAVYEFIKNAADHIRAGKGPVFVEAQTYRYFGHSKSDRNLYRTKDEIDYFKTEEDPISRFRNLLFTAGILDEKRAGEIRQEEEVNIDKAVEFAENSPEPDVTKLTEWVYA